MSKIDDFAFQASFCVHTAVSF